MPISPMYANVRNRNYALIVTLSGALVWGCGSSVPVTEGDTASPTVTPAVATGTDAAKPTSKVASEAAAVVDEPVAFEPPFPDRTDLFAQPNANKVAAVVRERREQSGPDLQLKGFVNVGEPRAMLRIDGELWIARAGESRAGVEVVTITPPQVTIKRDEKNIELSLRDAL